MWYRYILVWYSNLIQFKSPHGLQSPGVRLGTMCKGEDQLEEEGRIAPSSNMWSNSWREIRRCLGARRLVLEDTDGPVDVMDNAMLDRPLSSTCLCHPWEL